MGQCACKQLCPLKNENSNHFVESSHRNAELSTPRTATSVATITSANSSAQIACLPSTLPVLSIGRSTLRMLVGAASGASGDRQSYVDKLVLNTLKEIRTMLDNYQSPPRSMISLHVIADKEKGWLSVISSIIAVIPLHEPLGPAVILLLLEDCSLPTREGIAKLSTILRRLDETHNRLEARSKCEECALQKQDRLTLCAHENACTRHRNACIVLACLAEKLAGPNSIALLCDYILHYLLSNLKPQMDGNILLFSLIALEKFSQTSENKRTIFDQLSLMQPNPLFELEKWVDDQDALRHQIGFCTQWCLDNLFVFEHRPFTYQVVREDKLNAILNANDVSEYLKISPCGLAARCDAGSFESVRSTFQMDEGCWYYEATVITCGVMQIGFATKNSRFLSDEGYGIGDDEYSVAYDGCRQFIWHDAKCSSIANQHPSWKSGDILGCLIDLTAQQIVFSLNGVPLKPEVDVFKHTKSGFFAAASFMSFQECKFNFGSQPFSHPPTDRPHFQSFNAHASLSEEQRKIYPKHIKLKNMHLNSLKENCCTLCYDAPGLVTLRPCSHEGFCLNCSLQLDNCPLCRSKIEERLEQPEVPINSTDQEPAEEQISS